MNYELAKELKDAGFPQHRTQGQQDAADRAGAVYFPTLTELIEACGEAFISLVRADFPGTSGKLWTAIADGHAMLGKIEGSTPEEAVARLWLALNKS